MIRQAIKNTTYNPFNNFGTVSNDYDYSIWQSLKQITFSEYLYKPLDGTNKFAKMNTAQPAKFSWDDGSGTIKTRQAVYNTSIGVGRTNQYSVNCAGWEQTGAYGLVMYEEPGSWCTPNGNEVGFGLFSGDPRGCHMDGMNWSWGTNTQRGNKICPDPTQWKNYSANIGIR